MTNRMTFEQVASLHELMRDHDAQEAALDFDPGSSDILHASLTRDDEDTPGCCATISVAGHVRRWATVTA